MSKDKLNKSRRNFLASAAAAPVAVASGAAFATEGDPLITGFNRLQAIQEMVLTNMSMEYQSALKRI